MDKKQTYKQKNRPTTQRLRVGDTIPLKIKRLGINGEGIGYFQRTICFIKGALPGEQIIAKITDIKPRFITGETAKIKKVSPDRVEPRDNFANEVGGFELEHLSYAAQLEFKRDVIKQSLAKFRPEGYKQYDLRPTIGMDDPTGYRNKAQFQVRRLDGKVLAGMYTEGTHDLVDLPEVSVQHPLTMQIMRFIVDLLDKYSVSIYNERKNVGDVKTIIVRVAVKTNQAQVVFVTNSAKLPYKDEMVEDLQAEFSEIKSIMQNINPGRNSLIWGNDTRNIAGDSFITEKMDGLSFKLSARAFFQLNPFQTVKLYDEARKALELSDNDNLVDAYSGVGTIGLSLAKRAKEVRGMDTIAEAVDDANENAKLNGIDNAHYETGAAEKLLPKWQSEGFKPDSLVVDPPRVGLDERLIQAILASLPKHFVYISCNPSTLARDLVPLVKKYRVEYIQSIDMFPETARVEAVVKLTLR